MECKRDSFCSNEELIQKMCEKKKNLSEEFSLSLPHFPPSPPFWTGKERKQAGGVGCGNVGGRLVGGGRR